MKILLTPHTPHTKNLVNCWLVAVSLFCTTLTNIYAQPTTAPQLQTLPIYERSLKEYYVRLINAKREEFKELRVKSWLYYMPNVGLQFGLPSITIGTDKILGYKRDKQIQAQQLKSLEMRTELEFNQLLQTIRLEHRKLVIGAEKLKSFEEKYKAFGKLKEIKKECCSKNQCTPEECRVSELEEYTWKETQTQMKTDYSILVLQFEILAHYLTPSEKL